MGEPAALLGLRDTSMGPRSDERGNRAVRLAGGSGYAVLLQWGRAPMSAEIGQDLRLVLREVDQTSMGPRSDERGNIENISICGMVVLVLQWGRAPMSAEMRTAEGERRW